MILLVPLLAVYDRLCGWIAGGVKGWLLTALLAVAFWRLIPDGGVLPSALLAFFIGGWRDLPRNTLGAAIAPDPRRVPETLAFNLLFLFPTAITLALGFKAPPLVTFGLWPVLEVICTALAYAYGRLEPWSARRGTDLGAFLEPARGLAVGAYLFAALASR